MKMIVEQVNSEGLVAGQSMTLEVLGGTRATPTVDELLGELPEFGVY